MCVVSPSSFRTNFFSSSPMSIMMIIIMNEDDKDDDDVWPEEFLDEAYCPAQELPSRLPTRSGPLGACPDQGDDDDNHDGGQDVICHWRLSSSLKKSPNDDEIDWAGKRCTCVALLTEAKQSVSVRLIAKVENKWGEGSTLMQYFIKVFIWLNNMINMAEMKIYLWWQTYGRDMRGVVNLPVQTYHGHIISVRLTQIIIKSNQIWIRLEIEN